MCLAIEGVAQEEDLQEHTDATRENSYRGRNGGIVSRPRMFSTSNCHYLQVVPNMQRW